MYDFHFSIIHFFSQPEDGMKSGNPLKNYPR